LLETTQRGRPSCSRSEQQRSGLRFASSGIPESTFKVSVGLRAMPRQFNRHCHWGRAG
jgi:hypothetical protein